jgi:hypothetical protein
MRPGGQDGRQAARGARHARRDAGLCREGARRPHDHRRGQHRHRRLRPRPADGGAGARGVRRAGQALSLRLERRRPRAGRRAARPGAGAHAVPDRLQDLHHGRDDDQRALGQALVRAIGRHRHRRPLRRAHHQCRSREQVRHRHHLRLLGLGGRPLFAVVGHRPADRAGHRRRRFPPAARGRACDGRALPHRAAREEPAGAAGPARCLVPQLPQVHEPQHRAVPQRA